MDAGLRITHFSDIERLEEIGVAVSIETVGKSYDIATSESMCAIFKTEWFRNNTVHHEIGGHWKGFDLLDLETRKWVSWFIEEHIFGELDELMPAEAEANYAGRDEAKAA